MEKKLNKNIQLTRFTACIMVIIAHAFPVSLGEGAYYHIPCAKYLSQLGEAAVFILFFAGGYMNSKSIDEKEYSFGAFIYARCRKIFPPLWITVALSMFMIGPIFTTYKIRDYFLQKDLYMYLLNGILIPYHSLPGVFQNNAYLPTVNASLWTLPVEFLCYLAVYLFYRLGKFEKKALLWAVPAVGVIVFWGAKADAGRGLIERAVWAACVFAAGCFVYILRESIPRNKIVFYSCVVLSMSAFLLTGSLKWFEFLGIYILYYYWFSAGQTRLCLYTLGNYSYEIYLAGFPLAQCIVTVFGGRMNPYLNMLLTVAAAIPLAKGIAMIVNKLHSFNLGGKV